MNLSPTPHPNVNDIVALLFTKVKEILQDQLTGMYLHGSLANGGFDAHSDIDIIFTTKDEMSDEMFSALKAMHLETAKIDSPWANQLEVAYIPQEFLGWVNPTNIRYPHLDRGDGEVLHHMSPESDWAIVRHILRERGITIFGVDPKTLISPVSPDELRQAVAEGMPVWFNPIIANPSEMNTRGYQSFFVLSICRMLYTLKYGEILSKPAAAEWGLNNLDGQWHSLIERAIVGRQNSNLDSIPQDVQETVEMMKFALTQIKPTLYLEVNEILKLLLQNVKEILQDQFIGMYLYGSLSSGDFNPESSDIDFLVVTNDYLSKQTILKLESMHSQTWASSLKRAGKLEGAYLPKELIRKHDPNADPCPTVNEGKFYLDRPGSDWIIQRHVVREFGVIIEGPDPKTLIDFVRPDDIRNAVMGILHEWWFPMLNDPSWLRDHEIGYRSFAVITMCRVLHALEHGTIVSKAKATQWAQTKLGNQWSEIISRAVAVSEHKSEILTLDETLALIQLIREETLKVGTQP